MDLGAYDQIKNLEHILTENNIYIPRLRGLRLMSEEKIMELHHDRIKDIVSDEYVNMCRRRMYRLSSDTYELSPKTESLLNRYGKKELVHDDKGDIFFTGMYYPDFSKIHGKAKKKLKLEIKHALKRHEENYRIFNKYVGRNDVLYVHARIGGDNWEHYKGEEIMTKDWFIEKSDDPYDSTYCDIYVKIKPIK